MDQNYQKKLAVKTNAVKRLVKEYFVYNKDVEKLQSKYDEMKANNEDEYDLNKKKEYLDESISVRNVTKTKLRNITDELIQLINEIDDDEIKKLEEYNNACEMKKTAIEFFENYQDN